MLNFKKEEEQEIIDRCKLLSDSFSNERQKKLMDYRINHYLFTQTICGGRSELELETLKHFVNAQIKVLNYE